MKRHLIIATTSIVLFSNFVFCVYFTMTRFSSEQGLSVIFSFAENMSLPIFLTFVFSCALLLFSIVLIIATICKVSKVDSVELDLKKSELENAMLLERYKKSIESTQSLRMIRHDFNNVLQALYCLDELNDEKSKEHAKSLLLQLNSSIKMVTDETEEVIK